MITEEDLKVIKEFIDNYQTIVNKYSEYKKINESIRKNIIFQTYNDTKENIEETNYKRTKLINEIQNQKDEYRQKFLLNQMNTLEEDISIIEKYKQINIEEKYMEMYSGNLSIYIDKKEDDEIEPPTKIYTPKTELLEKDYYYNEKTTITQIYTRIKSIYNYYRNSIPDSKLEKNIKFFEKFKQAIYKYNEKNKQLISTLLAMPKEKNELSQKSK